MPATRRRGAVLSAGASLAAAIAVLIAILIGSGTREQGPATGAAAFVPADALAYVHVSTDSGRPAVKQALSVAQRFPDYPLAVAAVSTRLSAIVGGSDTTDFARDIRPWLGREAALALLNTSTSTAGSLIVLDVRDRARARAFLRRAGAEAIGSYDGAQLLRYAATGTELAFLSHYLVVGEDSAVRAAADVATGRLPSLQTDPTYRRASAGEAADRVLDIYASATGIRRVLGAEGGLLQALGVLLSPPALSGLTISVSATPGGARVAVHSVLDPTLARLSPHRSKPFAPTLQNVLPSGSAMMLDLGGLPQVAPRLLQAATLAGLAGRIGPLFSRLGAALRAEGVDLSGVLSIFSGETAVAVTSGGQAPALVVVTRTHNPSAVQAELGALQQPLAQLLPPPASGPGQASLFNDRQVGGVTAHQLVLAPGLQLDYAVFHGLVVFSTSLDGIVQVAQHVHSLASAAAYQATLRNRPATSSSLLFLDFSQLLSLGEQTGLIGGGRYEALRGDLARVHAIGLASTSGETDTTAELFLQIS